MISARITNNFIESFISTKEVLSLHELHSGAVSVVRQMTPLKMALSIRIIEPGRYIFEMKSKGKKIKWEYLIDEVPFFDQKNVQKGVEEMNVTKITDDEDIYTDYAVLGRKKGS